ncbi:MAG: hypothetical protein P8R02_09245 [Pseudomonadales bacterium]|nr:hypothetical protein [Pseudomonadales bacterium]
MVEKYTIEIESGITFVNFNIAPSYKDIEVLLAHLAKENIYERRLFNLGDLKFDISASELESIAKVGKNLFKRPNKGALVATQDISVATGGQLSVYSADDKISFLYLEKKKKH